MSNATQLNPYRNGNHYEDLNAVIQDTKVFGGIEVPWSEEFEDNNNTPGITYQIELHFDVLIKKKTIRRTEFLKIVCKGGVMDKCKKLKLKPGDCIRFDGEYKVRKGYSRWFKSFEVLHPDFIDKVKSVPVGDI